MLISIIVAASANNAIGKNNQLLWKLPKDLKFFKNTTWGNAIVMGRKTFESLGNKPLPGRLNIVITRQQGWNANGVTVVHSLDDIHWSEEMEAAWKDIQNNSSVTMTIDLFFIGIVLLRNEFKVKQHFSVRF